MVNGSVIITEFKRVSTPYSTSFNEKEPHQSRAYLICPSFSITQQIQRYTGVAEYNNKCIRLCRYFYTETYALFYFTGAHTNNIIVFFLFLENLVLPCRLLVLSKALAEKGGKKNYQKGLSLDILQKNVTELNKRGREMQ